MKNNLPKRKHPRLPDFDYSSNGAYFITICSLNRKCVFSRIVGRGLAPAETVKIKYTKFGEIARLELLELKNRFPFLDVDKFVIMPNHIHIILLLNNTAGASPRPTIMDIICAYKSLTTLECKKHGLKDKLFQDSFYEHIIRGQADYDEISSYIKNNPLKWHLDKLYVE